MSERTLRRLGAYGTAIAWIVMHDDIGWLRARSGEPPLPVTARLVAAVFARTDQEIVADLLDAARRFGKTDP